MQVEQDLVQTRPGPSGPIADQVRTALDPWLGEPCRHFKGRSVTLRLKVEMNTTDQPCLGGLATRPFEVASPWFTGMAQVQTFTLEELLATKLRALFQRSKGRDLFDLRYALEHGAPPAGIVEAFLRYMEHEQRRLGAREFWSNVVEKLRDPDFKEDVRAVLAGSSSYDPAQAFAVVAAQLLSRLPGGAELEGLMADEA